MKFHFPGLQILLNLVRKIFPNAGNVAHYSLAGNDFDTVRETFDIQRGPAVRSYAKRVRALNFEKIRNLVEDGSDFEVPHCVVSLIVTGKCLLHDENAERKIDKPSGPSNHVMIRL